MMILDSHKRVAKLVLATAVSALLIGCETIGYYQQAASGQLSILLNRQPIEKILQDSALSQDIRNKLVTVLEIREFAEQQLGLPVADNYDSFVNLDRNHVVWNVFAATEFSIEPVNWCYPIAGCVSYRGYFSEARALNYASKLQSQGYDVYTGGVDAYSTLGWFRDPIPSTVLNRSNYQLAALVFHELAHQIVYISGDTTFNESFATALEQEGLQRWLDYVNDLESLVRAQAEARRRQEFIQLVMGFRGRFDQLYQSEASQQNKRNQKQVLQRELQVAYGNLKQNWGGIGAYDGWFAGPLNNAQLSTVASYNDLVPAFQVLLDQAGGDLATFYVKVQELAKLNEADRKNELATLLVN